MALTVTLDKSVYTPGAAMVLTVKTTAADRDRFVETPLTVHVSVPGLGDADATSTLRKQVDDAPVSVSDPDRVWALRSDDGVTAIFDATA